MKNSRFPGSMRVVDRPDGTFLSVDNELFDALYAYTGRRSKKKRQRKKQVKKLINKALRNCAKDINEEESN